VGEQVAPQAVVEEAHEVAEEAEADIGEAVPEEAEAAEHREICAEEPHKVRPLQTTRQLLAVEWVEGPRGREEQLGPWFVSTAQKAKVGSLCTRMGRNRHHPRHGLGLAEEQAEEVGHHGERPLMAYLVVVAEEAAELYDEP
jgi:hypothetical protein